MHNEAFAKLGLDYCYMCYEVNHENLEKTVEGLSLIHILMNLLFLDYQLF